MTTPSTTTPEASPVLGPDPDRATGEGDASVQPPLDQEAAAEVADEAGEALDKPTVAAYRDGEGRVHYASPYSKQTLQHLAADEWTAIDPNAPAFDPTGHLVREVVAYLEENAADEAEVARVKAAEVAGEDRPTIAAWSPDQQ